MERGRRIYGKHGFSRKSVLSLTYHRDTNSDCVCFLHPPERVSSNKLKYCLVTSNIYGFQEFFRSTFKFSNPIHHILGYVVPSFHNVILFSLRWFLWCAASFLLPLWCLLAERVQLPELHR